MKKTISFILILCLAFAFTGCSRDPNRNPSKYKMADQNSVFNVAKIDKTLTLEDNWASYLKEENAIYLIKNDDTRQEVKDRKHLSAKVFGFHDGQRIYFYGIVNDKTPLLNNLPWDNIYRGDCVELAFAEVKGANLKKNSPGGYFKYIFTKNTETGKYISDGRPTSGVFEQGPKSLTYSMDKFPDNKGYWFKAIIDTTVTNGDNLELSKFLNLKSGKSEAFFGIFIDNTSDGKRLDTEIPNIIWSGHVNRSDEFYPIKFAK